MLLIGRKGAHVRWFESTSNDVTFEVVLHLDVQIASKVTIIDLNIAPNEGVSGEPYHSSSVPEAGRY